VVSALGIQARGPGFDSRVVPLFHWVATLGKLFTQIAPSQFLSSKKPFTFRFWGLTPKPDAKGSFRRLSGYGD